MFLLQLNELFNISSPCFTSADHFILIDIQEEDLTCLCSHDQGVSLGLVTQSSHIGDCVELFDRNVTDEVEVSVLVAFENRDLSVIGSTEDELILGGRISKDVSHVKLMFVKFLHKDTIF